MNKELVGNESDLVFSSYLNIPCGRLCLYLAARRGALSKEFLRSLLKTKHPYYNLFDSEVSKFKTSFLEVEVRYLAAKATKELYRPGANST